MSTLAQQNPFALDPKSEVPVGTQLAWRLRALILTGRIAPGERLPSLRRVAGWAGVNVNTVRAVYESLEQAKLLVSQHGRGSFVAEGVAPEPELEAIALEALSRAQRAGRDPRDLAMIAMACADMLAPDEEVPLPAADLAPEEEGAAGTIEVRQELRRQIGRLEAELAAYVRDLPQLFTATPRATAHVADVEELEQTRDTLIAKLSEARKVAEERARRAGEERRSRRDPSSAGPLADAKNWWNESDEPSR